MLESLRDRIVLVTAAASGIGRVIAEQFLAAGSRVHVCDIDPDAIEEFLDSNPEASATVADVSSPEAVDRLFDELASKYAGLDILVNNAGIAGPVDSLENISPEGWKRTIDVNLHGQFYVTRRAIPIMKSQRSGCIVNISSTAALFGCPLRGPYVASKWAMIGVTKTLAMELGPWNIRVNAVCPGSVQGERIERVIAEDARERGKTADEIRSLYQRQTSLQRFVTAEEVASMTLFLASDACPAISGQAMSVDGHTESLSRSLEQ